MRDVYLYGAGSFGRLMFGIFKQSQKANVVGFIDRAARDGQTLFGLSVLPLDDMRIPPDANVLICITLASEDYGDLYHSLQSRNPDWSITNGQSIMADRVKYDRDNYSGDMDSPNVKNRIQQARRLLCDEHSETVFDSNLNAHKNRDYSGCFSSCGCKQYFPDVLSAKSYGRIIECGAYIGDTSRLFAERAGHIETYVGFEPERELFRKLSAAAREYSASIDNTFLYPCAVGDENTTARFGGPFGNGTICDEGENYIQIVRIDDALPKFAPTLIKMDIEGAETDAIRGAEQTIRAHRPDLAICVYHYVSDLWEIPLLIHEYNPRYKFYLRAHTTCTMETVLYATDGGKN